MSSEITLRRAKPLPLDDRDRCPMCRGPRARGYTRRLCGRCALARDWWEPELRAFFMTDDYARGVAVAEIGRRFSRSKGLVLRHIRREMFRRWVVGDKDREPLRQLLEELLDVDPLLSRIIQEESV